MSRITFLMFVVISLASCGGGGGGGGSTPAPPKVSVSGPSAVWSDDMDWSAKATASGHSSISIRTLVWHQPVTKELLAVLLVQPILPALSGWCAR